MALLDHVPGHRYDLMWVSTGQFHLPGGHTQGRRAVDMVIQNPDVRVHDPVALDEIEMYSNLIIAAFETDGPLTQNKIDEILGNAHADRPKSSGQGAA